MKVNQAVLALLLAGVTVLKLPAQTLQTLVSFNGTNGSQPTALTLGNDDNFYGTTFSGGSGGHGTVFQFTTNGTLNTFVVFNSTNGATPYGGLTLGNDGNFYGTTTGGGNGYGTVFQLVTNGTLNTLYSFSGGLDGRNPSTLLLGSDGNFYGTTSHGGSTYNDGTVFKVTTNGTLTTLASFNGTDGANPYDGLTLGNDGYFYGTTFNGGNSGTGTIFKVSTNGTLTTLVSFFPNAALGGYPYGGLTLGNDGNFYGTTTIGGTSEAGIIFKVATNGTLTRLYFFTGGLDGAQPEAALTLGSDGNFYGTTSEGGTGYGTVFQVTTNGTLTTLFVFNSANGANSVGALTLGSDGNFYGTTELGGNTNLNSGSGYGTVFRLLIPPVITLQPLSQTNYTGSTVTFLVSATSLNSMGFQWQKNGTNLVDGDNISGSATNTLTITGISDSDAANYSVIVTTSNGTVTSSNATLTVNDFPFIATQPLSQIIGVGSNVTFTAIAYGAPPFVFQWYYNDSPVGSPTSDTNVSSYMLTNVQTNQSGNYSVQVINGDDSVMSSNAVLTVQVFPPSIGTQPSSQSVMIGSNVCFTISVSGTTPFYYQWFFNSANILNATNAFYTIQTVGTNSAGNYSVMITNSAGSVTSSNAVLIVIVPPTMALQFLAGYPLLNLNGMLSNNFLVQYSTNLASTNWMNLLLLSNLSSSPYEFLDPAGVVPPARFYRAEMQ